MINLNYKQKILNERKVDDVSYPVVIVDNQGAPTDTPVIELLKGNKDYVFTTPLTRLTIKQISFSALTSSIVFTSGDSMAFDYPADLLWVNDEFPTIEENEDYIIMICNNIAVINKVKTIEQ